MFSRMRLLGAQSSPAARAGVGSLVLAFGLTACGGSGDEDESATAQTVRAAYEKTISAETVHVALTGRQKTAQSPSQQQGQQARLSGQAVLDFADDASSATVKATGASETVTRTIGDVLYRKVPKQQRAQVPGKKPWIKVDLRRLWQARYGDRAGDMLDNPPTDPVGMLAYLRGVTQAQKSGNAEVRGAQTTHYTAKVDLLKAAKGRGPQAERRMRQLEKQLGDRPLSIHVWLDEQNRVRRLRTALPARTGNVVLTEEFYDYGASVQVTAPADGKTANVTTKVIQRQKMRQQRRERMQQQRQQQD